MSAPVENLDLRYSVTSTMPNTTPETDNLREVKRLITEGLDNEERWRLRSWLLAKFDVQGNPQ
jgi:hypothetical protein